MSFVRCFSTLGCPELGLESVFALAAKHRIGAVELRALRGTIDLPAHFAEQFGEPEALARAVRAQGVRVVALDGSLRLVGATAADREQFAALAPWAEALGVRHLRAFDGGKSGDAAEIAEAVSTLRWWRELRRERGWKVDVMVETHDSLFTTAALERLLAAAPDVALLWDSHHTWKKGGEDPFQTWTAIRSRVVHVHVKDSVSRAEAPGRFTYAMPGRGEFPFAALLTRLRDEKFAGPVSIEWERLWIPELAPLDDVLAAAESTGVW